MELGWGHALMLRMKVTDDGVLLRTLVTMLMMHLLTMMLAIITNMMLLVWLVVIDTLLLLLMLCVLVMGMKILRMQVWSMIYILLKALWDMWGSC